MKPADCGGRRVLSGSIPPVRPAVQEERAPREVPFTPTTTSMKSLLRLLLLPALLVSFRSAEGGAQEKKIIPGLYEMVPDANFSADFDPTGVVIELTDVQMTATMQGQLLIRSKISLSGDIMTVEDLEGQVACPGIGKFKVSFTDKGFRMTPVEDPCAERGAVLAQVTMVKKG